MPNASRVVLNTGNAVLRPDPGWANRCAHASIKADSEARLVVPVRLTGTMTRHNSGPSRRRNA
eukprot:CAMPEP_0194270816 /NCGR_PEP_ID=MMETSP0169-20130528/4731_1 /TAXON_ID=218684 /ORGANISM="Corethron pennatum, Strain L29A3" /LENGTH=62 /DNA_ID=CAMNT_0039012991 /DNA_START=67 /DNA_END=251 /DNA_ORIENTATION=-